MSFGGITSESGDYTARIGLPVRGKQAGKSRNEVHAAVVFTVFANVSISELVRIRPRLSRSHCTSAPVMATLPSRA